MRKFILVSALFLTGCPYQNDVVRPDPQEPEDTEWCEAGCNHLAELPGQDGDKGCFESRPLDLPDGGVVSCEQFCVETQIKGRALNPKCWTTIESCDEIEKVCRR